MSQRIWIEEVVSFPSLNDMRRADYMQSPLRFVFRAFDGEASILLGEVQDVEAPHLTVDEGSSAKRIVLRGMVKRMDGHLWWKRRRVFDLVISLYPDETDCRDTVIITER